MDHWTPVRDGIHDVVETITAIKEVLDYEPDMVQVHPLAWVVLDSWERAGAPAGMIGRNYRFMVRIATPVQNSKGAEDELIAAALLVADAMERNKQLSGAITEGLAVQSDGRVGWVPVGTVRCRVTDVFVTAYLKYTY